MTSETDRCNAAELCALLVKRRAPLRRKYLNYIQIGVFYILIYVNAALKTMT